MPSKLWLIAIGYHIIWPHVTSTQNIDIYDFNKQSYHSPLINAPILATKYKISSHSKQASIEIKWKFICNWNE